MILLNNDNTHDAADNILIIIILMMLALWLYAGDLGQRQRRSIFEICNWNVWDSLVILIVMGICSEFTNPPSPKLKLSAPHLWGITGETPLPPCVVVVGWATWDVRERMWSGRTMDAIRHHHRSHNHLPTRYTPTLYYSSCMSVAQPPSQDMVTLYTRHTTVVQPTPDLPTF